MYGNGLVSLNRWYIDVFKTTRILITHHLLTCNPTTKHINKWKVYEEILGNIALKSNTENYGEISLNVIFVRHNIFTFYLVYLIWEHRHSLRRKEITTEETKDPLTQRVKITIATNKIYHSPSKNEMYLYKEYNKREQRLPFYVIAIALHFVMTILLYIVDFS